MHFATSWHANGLRWIASLFLDAANFLERNDARPCEGEFLPTVAAVEDIRARIHSRYY